MVAVVQALAVGAGLALEAAPTPNPTQLPRYVDPSVVSPGLIGFFIFLGLGLATVLLWWSMNRQLKKIDFDDGTGRRRPDTVPRPLPSADDQGPGDSGPGYPGGRPAAGGDEER